MSNRLFSRLLLPLSVLLGSNAIAGPHCLPTPLTTLQTLSMPDALADTVVVTETLTVAVPVARVFAHFEQFPLPQLLTETTAISGVATTYPIIGNGYLEQGDRRAVCLSDGYGAIEQLRINDHRQHFAYRVWGYTLPEAGPIRYADGEFRFEPAGEGTRIIWRYQFALQPDRFPGYLGGVGRWLFQRSFAEPKWRPYMQQGLHNFALSLAPQA